MRDRLRVVWLALRLAVAAGGWRVAVIVACSLSIALQPSANAFALKLLTDGALRGDWGHAAIGIGVLAVLIAVLFSAYGIWVPLEATVSERAAQLFEQELMRLVAAIPTLEPHERPDFVDRLDVLRGNSRLLIGALWTTLSNVSFFVGVGTALGVLGNVDPILLVLPLFGLPMFGASLRSVRLRDRAMDRTAEPLRMASHLFRLTTTPSFGKELRMSRLADEVADRHDRLNRTAQRDLFAADLRAGLLSAGGWALFTLGWAGGVGLVVWRAARGQATPGDVVLALTVAGLVQGYISGAAGLVRNLKQTLSMAARYVWLRDLVGHLQIGRRPAPERLHRGIRLDRVSFTYPGTDIEVLHDVSATLPAGATIGVVGDNGAGKTTFIKLLLALYQPTSGRILVDDVDLAEIAPHEWRSRLAGAFQDFAKLEFTLSESVGVGDLDRVGDETAIRDAMQRAGSAEELPALDQQLGTAWADGVDLSGGQWQQLAVSRGMMRGQPLIRVLDEPTASLDADIEHALFERYHDAARLGLAPSGGVIILVSHRFSTMRSADLILVFDRGRLVEQGFHEELMRLEGLYAELFGLQARAYR